MPFDIFPEVHYFAPDKKVTHQQWSQQSCLHQEYIATGKEELPLRDFPVIYLQKPGPSMKPKTGITIPRKEMAFPTRNNIFIVPITFKLFSQINLNGIIRVLCKTLVHHDKKQIKDIK